MGRVVEEDQDQGPLILWRNQRQLLLHRSLSGGVGAREKLEVWNAGIEWCATREHNGVREGTVRTVCEQSVDSEKNLEDSIRSMGERRKV